MHWFNLATIMAMAVLFTTTLYRVIAAGFTLERGTTLVSTVLVILWCFIAHQWRREALTLYTIIDNARHVRTVKSKKSKENN